MTAAVTPAHVAAAVQTVAAIAEAIPALGSVPSGHLYAQVMPSGVSLAAYERCIEILKNADLVAESNHLLTWVGPKWHVTHCIEVPPP